MAERQRQQTSRRTQNKVDEEEGILEKKRIKETSNPWERVAANVELNAGQYVGQADVSRMRQALISRKNDITKANGKKNGSMF